MSKKQEVIRSNGGVFADLGNQIKLILRLMADPRVSPVLKLLPIGALVYLLVPDLVPGPIDDAIVIWIGGYLFVELCPPEVVQEHLLAIQNVIPGQWTDADGGEVIEGEVRDL